MNNMVGKLIGRYRIIEELGTGGMAVVYKAIDTALEREVAIKMILPDQKQSDKYLKRFSREAKTLRQLSHPSIVKIFNFGDFEGIPFLEMEYVGGGSLLSEKNRKSSPEEVASTLLPIARALSYCHQKKIIHRDIKPANILFNDAGQPLLADFGIAKLIETDESQSLTNTGAAVGTPAYMSPEQIQGKPVDGRSDIYSLGVVFFELLTGRKPYIANTPIEIALKHLNEATPHTRQYNRDITPEIDQVIYKAMAKKVEDRYQDMEAFANALEKIATKTKTGEHITLSPKQNKEKSNKLKVFFHIPLRAVIAAIFVLVLIAVISGLISTQKELTDPSITQIAQMITSTVNPTKTSTIAPTVTKEPSPTSGLEAIKPTELTTVEPTKANIPSNLIQKNNVSKVINLESMEKVPVIKLLWSPDGQSLLNAGGKALRIIKPIGMSTNATINLNDIPKDITVSADGNKIYALLGNTIQGFDLQSQKPISNFSLTSGGANSITLSSDGKTMAIGMLDSKVELINIEDGSVTRLLRSNFGGWSVAFTQDGKTIAAGTSKGVLMWEVETGTWFPISTGQNDVVKAVAFSNDGKLLAGGAENIIRIWDTQTGDEIGNYSGDFGYVYSLSFSPDDQLLASGSDDGIVRLIDVQNTFNAQGLKKHTSPIYSVAFSSFGDLLVSGELNGNIYLWGLPNSLTKNAQ